MTSSSNQPAVIFDYNGVLVNDEGIHEKAFARVLKDRLKITLTHEWYGDYFSGKWGKEGLTSFLKNRLRDVPEDLVAKLLGRKQNEYRSIVEPQNGPNERLKKVVEELLAIKQKVYKSKVKGEDVLYEGVEDVLQKLSPPFRLAIVTSTSHEELMSVLKGHPILEKFEKDYIITSKDITKGKPDPRGYKICLRRLGLSARDAVAVEDTDDGVQAVKASGMRCIAIAHTKAQKQKIARHVPDKVVDNIQQIDRDLVWEVLERLSDVT